jgi:hypothetical protein
MATPIGCGSDDPQGGTMNLEPRVTVLGVHPLNVTAELLEAQIGTTWSADEDPPERRADAERRARGQLEGAVLVEIRIDAPPADPKFFDRITHDSGDVSPQAPWLETLLTADGSGVLPERVSDTLRAGLASLRIAFYLHYFDAAVPLVTPFGDVRLLPPSPMPERLQRLVPYQIVD